MNSNLKRKPGVRQAVIKVGLLGYPSIRIEGQAHIDWKDELAQNLFPMVIDHCTPTWANSGWDISNCWTEAHFVGAIWSNYGIADTTKHFQDAMYIINQRIQYFVHQGSPHLELPSESTFVVVDHGKLVISDFYKVEYDVKKFELAYAEAIRNHNVLSKWQEARRLYTAPFMNTMHEEARWVLDRREDIAAMATNLDKGIERMKPSN